MKRPDRRSPPRGGRSGPPPAGGKGRFASRSLRDADRDRRDGGRRDAPPRREFESRDRRDDRRPPPSDRRNDPRHADAARPTASDDGRYIWGVNPVLEALRANPDRIERVLMHDGGLTPKLAGEVFSRVRDAGLRLDKVDRDRLASLTNGGVHQGLAAEVRQFDYLELEQLIRLSRGTQRAPLIVVLDGIQDPHNLGAIIRSAHAFGAHGVVIARDRATGVTGVVAKSSAGAIEYCPVARVTNLSRALEELKKANFWTVAADPGGDRTHWAVDFKGPIAIVVGAEGPGVRDGVLKHCDFRVQIPMVGKVASLNASVSAGVLLAELSRQRAVAPPVAPS